MARRSESHARSTQPQRAAFNIAEQHEGNSSLSGDNIKLCAALFHGRTSV